MNIFIIASAIVALTLLAGIGLAYGFVRLSEVVAQSHNELEKKKSAYNPSLTMGLQIPVTAEREQLMKEARKLAAKKAAQTPRGANMRVGRMGTVVSASQNVREDPITAAKIAQVHGWQGVRTGPVTGNGAQATGPTAARQAAPAKRPEDLKPGKDYPYIEITDSMSPDEMRKARIANAKAQSAAVKALKQAGAAAGEAAEDGGVAPMAAPSGEAPLAAPAAGPVAGGDGELVPGRDYATIEITDDMPPDEVRKARIANAKAASAAAKARKAAGGPPAGAASPAAAPTAAPVAEAVAMAAAPAATIPASIPKPDYIEITEGTASEEIRTARIHNSKARSAYHKALKEAGIDPASVGE